MTRFHVPWLAAALHAGPQLAQVNVITQNASPCSAGQVQYAPPPTVGPCYVCSPGTQNPAPGATCQQCSIAYTEPDTDRSGCTCAAGWSPLLSVVTGKLQQCVQDGLRCNYIPHSVVNIVGNACTCSTNFTANFDSTGKLVVCEERDSAPGPRTTVPSGMRTNITLPSSSGTILFVGNCSSEGRASVVKGSDGIGIISYISR